ncbi:MAG: helix-hairpin-helix domain-containing protein, partial [Candidatus Humimicrobiaceae bacterium]
MNDLNPATQIKLTGVIERVIFKNSETGYVIAKFTQDSCSKTETIFGIITEANPGEHIEICGEYVNNPKYGLQFKIINSLSIPPATMEGIEKYLGSGLIKGIGPAMAGRIVSIFKEKTLDILDREIDRLNSVEGFGKKRIEQIKKEWCKQSKIKEIMIFLQSLEITPAYAKKIYNKYNTNSINIINENPYRLCDDIFGIGFKIADKIAKNAGIEKESVFRIKSGIIYMLGQLQEAGNCYFPYESLIEQAKDFLDVEINDIR